MAENSDLVILCVGLDAFIEGEEGDAGNEFASGDKIDLRLPEPQRKLVSKIMEKGKPVIIVTAAGSAMNMEADCDAIIHAWYPGQFGGLALANILFGKVSPSGKLPVTFYESADKLPPFENYSMADRTYRYVQGNVLYPFGYGLTYSKTVCSDLKADSRSASVTITNAGSVDTDDVVQFYIKGDSEADTPNPKLCGFARVSLKAGESRTVTVTLPQCAFETVDDEGVRAVRSTVFTLYAGTCQPDALSESLTATKTLSTEIHL